MSTNFHNDKVNTKGQVIQTKNRFTSKGTHQEPECPSNNKGHRVQVTHTHQREASPSTYDTIKLTTPLLDENRIKNINNYTYTVKDGDVRERKLILGVDFNGNVGSNFNDYCTTIGITCLLYTSPSPRD